MNQPATAAIQLPDPARFGAALRSVGMQLDLSPMQIWNLCDCTWFARQAPDTTATTALVMACHHPDDIAGRAVILFYGLILDCWPIDQEQHDAMLLTIDPSFDPDGASE